MKKKKGFYSLSFREKNSSPPPPISLENNKKIKPSAPTPRQYPDNMLSATRLRYDDNGNDDYMRHNQGIWAEVCAKGTDPYSSPMADPMTGQMGQPCHERGNGPTFVGDVGTQSELHAPHPRLVQLQQLNHLAPPPREDSSFVEHAEPHDVLDIEDANVHRQYHARIAAEKSFAVRKDAQSSETVARERPVQMHGVIGVAPPVPSRDLDSYDMGGLGIAPLDAGWVGDMRSHQERGGVVLSSKPQRQETSFRTGSVGPGSGGLSGITHRPISDRQDAGIGMGRDALPAPRVSNPSAQAPAAAQRPVERRAPRRGTTSCRPSAAINPPLFVPINRERFRGTGANRAQVSVPTAATAAAQVSVARVASTERQSGIARWGQQQHHQAPGVVQRTAASIRPQERGGKFVQPSTHRPALFTRGSAEGHRAPVATPNSRAVAPTRPEVYQGSKGGINTAPLGSTQTRKTNRTTRMALPGATHPVQASATTIARHAGRPSKQAQFQPTLWTNRPQSNMQAQHTQNRTLSLMRKGTSSLYQRVGGGRGTAHATNGREVTRYQAKSTTNRAPHTAAGSSVVAGTSRQIARPRTSRSTRVNTGIEGAGASASTIVAPSMGRDATVERARDSRTEIIRPSSVHISAARTTDAIREQERPLHNHSAPAPTPHQQQIRPGPIAAAQSAVPQTDRREQGQAMVGVPLEESSAGTIRSSLQRWRQKGMVKHMGEKRAPSIQNLPPGTLQRATPAISEHAGGDAGRINLRGQQGIVTDDTFGDSQNRSYVEKMNNGHRCTSHGALQCRQCSRDSRAGNRMTPTTLFG